MIKRPLHGGDTVSPDDHRLRDEIELYYPSTYLFIKDRFCHVKSCKFDGECRKCPAGELRRYAARDSDRIGELMRQLVDKDKLIEYLSRRVDKCEKKLKMHGIPIED